MSARGGSFRRYTDNARQAEHDNMSDETMRAWRLAGRLVCSCSVPVPVRVAPFGATECRACRKRILADAVGFIGEVLDVLDA